MGQIKGAKYGAKYDCTKYLDVRDCKQVEPDGPEEEP